MNRDPFNNAFDAVLLLFMATLFLAVIFVEYRRRKCAQSLLPPSPGNVLSGRINVPWRRNADIDAHEVSYLDVTDAAEGSC